ncbi:MAG: DNA repair protein RadC [Bacteroidales bacterium]|nr:DNA repair protein RadC [Bacteroidales bacterium]
MANTNTVKHWSEEDQPREKLINLGGRSVSSAELIAILLRTGREGQNVVDLARELLNSVGGSLNRLSQMGVPEMMRIKGVGEAKAVTLSAALELGHRLSAERAERKQQQIRNSEDLYYEFVNELGNLDREEFWCIYLNQRHQPLHKCRIAQGGLTDVAIDMRMLFEPAFSYKATAIAVAHNHPTKVTTPSRQDDSLTNQIQKAGQLLKINLIDHIIIGNTPETAYGKTSDSGNRQGQSIRANYYSYSDMGRL